MAGRHKEAWNGRGAEPRPLRGLSRDGIVATAIAVADAEGPAAVSMRRIARDLRVGVMSLYWYVDQRMSCTSSCSRQYTPRSRRLSRRATGGPTYRLRPRYRAALRRHPWAIDFLGAGRHRVRTSRGTPTC